MVKQGEDQEPFIKVYDWMLSLDLTGNELLVYALIYSFCQVGCKEYFGTKKAIANRLKIQDTGVSRAIRGLKAKGLLKEYYNEGTSLVAVRYPRY